MRRPRSVRGRWLARVLPVVALGCLSAPNSTGTAILYGQVTSGGNPVTPAFVRIYTDYAAACDTAGAPSGTIPVDGTGRFRVKDDGPIRSGGTCYSLRAYDATDTTRKSPRMSFVLHFRDKKPYDSVQVSPILP